MKFLKPVLLLSIVLLIAVSGKSTMKKINLKNDQVLNLVSEAQALYIQGAKWNDTQCSGKSQSPIDIKEPMTYAENLELNVDKMINNLAPKKPLTADKGTFRMDGIMGTVTTRDPIIYHKQNKDIDLNFQCSRIVFHSPSEHSLYGEKMDVEMQIECDLLPKNSVWDYKNRAIVLSYLYKGDRSLDLNDDKVGLLKGFNFETLDFISHDTFQKMIATDKFVMYEGSRSALPCTENVLHIVSHIVYQIPQTDVEKIQTQITNTFRLPGGNARPIQPLNGRPLIRNFASPQQPTYRNKPLSFKN